MRNLYNELKLIIDNIDFGLIWPDFKQIEFALYDNQFIYLENDTIPYDQRFMGNTSINYEGRQIAIWNVDDVNRVNIEELSADLVHEMFHGYQLLNNETRFFNDIIALEYPMELNNYQLKYLEIQLLIAALNNSDFSVKETLLKKIVHLRKNRLETYGPLIKYEFSIETIEGTAEYCGLKSLIQTNPSLYQRRLSKHIEYLNNPKNIFDIRRSCYFTGCLLLILFDELKINFNTTIKDNDITIFEDVIALYGNDIIEMDYTYDSNIELLLNEEIDKRKKILDSFLNQPYTEFEGDFSICGYDPMNLVRLDNLVHCKYFLMVLDKSTNENNFILGPVVFEMLGQGMDINKYFTLNQ